MNRKFDYNLIKTLVLVYETRSMSKAALALRVSAPTLTYSLNKLRDYYNDPLFIKTARGLKMTPLANQLYSTFKIIDDDISKVIGDEENKSPVVNNIIIRTNAMVEKCLIDRLMKAHNLPSNISFEFTNRFSSDDKRISAIVSREVDIDIGAAISSKNSFISTKIFNSNIVALCRIDHPRIGRELTQQQWLAEEHVMIIGPELQSFLPVSIDALLLERKIRYRSDSVLNILHCVESSNMIMLAPAFLASSGGGLDNFKIRSVNLPWLADEKLSMYSYIHSKAKNDENLRLIINLLSRSEESLRDS